MSTNNEREWTPNVVGNVPDRRCRNFRRVRHVYLLANRPDSVFSNTGRKIEAGYSSVREILCDQDHVRLFDYIFNLPRFTFEGKEHKLQIRLNVDISRETMVVESPNIWTENPSQPLDAAASEESEGITVAAEPTGGETQGSGTDSAIGQPYGALGP
ncbi:hypothetical protein BpHYR1_026599 [Brachionus plicatilis]|uniref:Uncharacterized protein n=1 Tax=Brachionus plicatilis TaxID=10195 RepID=A0A3M7P6R9_BRAPC|nr:hypothetical protein BpHYR1_026599 [Brachionus plicatilis]